MSKRPSQDTPAVRAAATYGPLRLLRLNEVTARTCLSKSEIYRRISAGAFPGSVSLARALSRGESRISMRGFANWQNRRSEPRRDVC